MPSFETLKLAVPTGAHGLGDAPLTGRRGLGFLDARIHHLTAGEKSLDDVMRLAYRRYSGARGYTRAQFRSVAREVAGADLDQFFQDVLEGTGELDYREALVLYGLRFANASDAAPWTLEPRPDATPVQRAALEALLGAR